MSTGSEQTRTVRIAAASRLLRFGIALIAVIAALASVQRPAAAQPADVVAHGAYLFALAGGSGCHTDAKNKGPMLAGGAPIKTPFGTFYGPNITPDPTYGIGKWSGADFIRELPDGIGPHSRELFPVLPYTSFTDRTDADMKALRA